MSSIFNSLGSNYSLGFVMLALKQMFLIGEGVEKNPKNSLSRLHSYLNMTYGGTSYLFYKGRDAIEFSLKILLNDDSNGKVLTQAFSCYAVEEGIQRAGMTPVYVDIDDSSTNMSVETLKKAFLLNMDSKAVLVQHSLGIPADIIEIKKWCLKNKLILIEDLAQAIGANDNTGKALGAHADAVVFSFGRDKIVDGISGGAVVFKNLTIKQIGKIESIRNSEFKKLSNSIYLVDMLYPFITFIGRKTHDFYLGKIILKIARLSGLIKSPTVSKTFELTEMRSGYATLILNSLQRLDEELLHRKKIANLYLNEISNKKIGLINSEKNVTNGSNLRFSITIDTVNELILAFKNSNIYLSDRWYRTAVDCGKQVCNTKYKYGSAVNAEKLSKEILNLPTHTNVSTLEAKKIIEVLNKF